MYTIRNDFRIKLHNMKKNVYMNTLTKAEKQVRVVSPHRLIHTQDIWVPKLLFANTEKKINTLNDDKAFAVARYLAACIKEFFFLK